MAQDDVVVCPSCSQPFTYSKLNAHLDSCLGLTQSPPVVPATTNSTTTANATAPLFNRKRQGSPKSRPDEPSVASTGKLPSTATPLKRPKTDTTAGPLLPTATPSSQPSTSRERLDSVAPLAERLRPRSLEDFVGQDGVINGPLKALLSKGIVPNAILWGPPGTGKTTLARILSRTPTNGGHPYRFVEISATTASSNDVKKIFDEAMSRLQLLGQRTILFIDEIQRFSRAQQDIFLPVIEKGHCILLAATTENPSFRLQGALLSRMRVFVLTKLSVDECFQVLRRARARVRETEERRRGDEGEDAITFTSSDASPESLECIDDDMLRWIANMADGDARTALSALEIAMATLDDARLSSAARLDTLKTALKRTALQYDRTGDQHYDCISALHKSIRGSNADAALFWLARMVESGDDPLFIARRLIVAASEDCNTLQALQMATATYQAVSVVGYPECAENLAQCVVFLAESTKSTRAYRGWKKAQALVRESYNFPVPIHLRNAPTTMMRKLGHGREYRYEPSFAHPVVQEYFPAELQGTRFLSPPPSSPEPDDVPLSGGAKAVSSKGSFPTMTSESGIGPGACQRIFQIGARSVDLDLLEEWERERNGGRLWSGRARLMTRIAEAQQTSAPTHAREGK